MLSDPTAFERYRNTATEKTNLPRLIIGTAIVVLFWVAITLVVVLGGTYLAIILHVLPGDPRGPLQGFLASPIGILTALTSFAGIWLGLWLAMRLSIPFWKRQACSAQIGSFFFSGAGGDRSSSAFFQSPPLCKVRC